MRNYLNIDLGRRSVETVELQGNDVAKCGRHLIAKTLLDKGAAYGCQIDPGFLAVIGVATVTMERKFNQLAGIGTEDDALPDFFFQESLPPTGKVARCTPAEVQQHMAELFRQQESVGRALG